MTPVAPGELLARLARLYPMQPATALWRAVEIAEVLRLDIGRGKGLDLGCGDGGLTGLLLRFISEAPEMTGIDPDPGEIAIAARRGVYKATVVGSGSAMPFESGAFDFVFSNSVLEHVRELDKTIAECARVLRPGGRLIATVPQPGFRSLLRGTILPWADRERALARVDARLGHLNYLDPEGWCELLFRHGLTLTMHRDYLDRRQVRRWEFFSGITGGLLQALGADNRMLYRLQRSTRADEPPAGELLDPAVSPSFTDRLWARLVAGGVLDGDAGDQDGPSGCLLLLAEKAGAG